MTGKHKKSGLRVLWIPTRKRHKGNKLYAGNSDHSHHRQSNLPNHDLSAITRKATDFDHSTNIQSTAPTTSLLASKQDLPPVGVTQEPNKKELNKNELNTEEDTKETLNTDYKNGGFDLENNTKVLLKKNDDFKDDKNTEDSKKNNNKLNAHWIQPIESKLDQEKENECTVNCLYYTLQCCECTIS